MEYINCSATLQRIVKGFCKRFYSRSEIKASSLPSNNNESMLKAEVILWVAFTINAILCDEKIHEDKIMTS